MNSLETGELQWCPYLIQFMEKYEKQDAKQALTLLSLPIDTAETQHPNASLWTGSNKLSTTLIAPVAFIGSFFETLWEKAIALVMPSRGNELETRDSSPVIREIWSPELVPYSGFGTSLAFSTDWHGQTALFAGAPRYGKELFQSGAVAIIDEDYNLDLIKGEDFGGQFGASIAVIGDILAVSAPFTVCAKRPEFTCGQVHLFDANSKTPFATLTSEGTSYPAFFGHKLVSGRLANDNVLIIGSPHANDQLDQAGVVHVLSETRIRQLRGDVDINTSIATRLTLPTSFRNTEGFDWFGWTSKTFNYDGKSYLAVGVPGHSEDISNKDIGAVILYKYDALSKSLDHYRTILGTERLGQFGKSIESVGSVLAISSPSEKVRNKCHF